MPVSFHHKPVRLKQILFRCVIQLPETKKKEQQNRLIRSQRKGSITMEENERRKDQEDPTPLSDEELEQFQKKEKRKITIIGDIIDFILNFFQ